MTEIFILSLIQGITEFLPISSSSHLILTSEYLDLENQNLSIDVSLHIGSFFAVLIYFYKDLINFFENRLLFLKIIVSSIPVILVGFFLVKSGTIESLMTSSVSYGHLIVGKFFALVTLLVIALACTLPILLLVSFLGSIDPRRFSG